jgi:hypothetical protein
MTSTALEEFGYEIRKQRIDWGWSLRKLAGEALDSDARSGYVSQDEKGLRNAAARPIIAAIRAERSI